MSRPERSTPGGVVQHVLNRGNDRKRLFTTDADYAAFISIVLESLLLHPLRILEYCVMPNHWHFVVWPAGDDDLSAFMHRLTTTPQLAGMPGEAGQDGDTFTRGRSRASRCKPTATCSPFAATLSEMCAVPNLVEHPQDWPWCSLHPEQPIPMNPWPIAKPRNWLDRVNQVSTLRRTRITRRFPQEGARPLGAASGPKTRQGD